MHGISRIDSNSAAQRVLLQYRPTLETIDDSDAAKGAEQVMERHSLCFHWCQRAQLLLSLSNRQTEPSEHVEQSVGKPIVFLE